MSAGARQAPAGREQSPCEEVGGDGGQREEHGVPEPSPLVRREVVGGEQVHGGEERRVHRPEAVSVVADAQVLSGRERAGRVPVDQLVSEDGGHLDPLAERTPDGDGGDDDPGEGQRYRAARAHAASTGPRWGRTTSARSASAPSSSVFRQSSEHLVRLRPVVGEHGDVPPARPGELDPERVEGGNHLRFAGFPLPADADRGVGTRVDRRLEKHLTPRARHAIQHPQQLEVERAVVEHAEEEDEVERPVLVQAVCPAQVAEHPGVRRPQLCLPALVEAPVLLEVREREERRPQPLVDPARVDPVLRPHLEHPEAGPVPAGSDVLRAPRA